MSDDFLSVYYKVVSNETSRKLILLLGENGSFKATELIERLDISPGTFYDALKKLKGIVEKSEDGRYTLTNYGRKFYYLLLEESKGFGSLPSSMYSLVFSLPYLFPLPLFKNFERQNLSVLLVVALIVVIAGSLSDVASRLIPVVMFMVPPYVSLPLYYYFLLFLVNTSLVISIYYFLLNIFGKIKDAIRFCLSLAISFIPIIIFSLIYYALYNIFFLNIGFVYYFLIYLIPLFFAFTISTTCVINYSNLRVDTSFIVSFIVLLVSFIASQIVLDAIIPKFI